MTGTLDNRFVQRAPGLAVSATAVVAASVLGWFLDIVIGTLFLTGLSVSAGTGPGPSISQLVVLILAVVAMRIGIAAWIVKSVVGLFGAHVTFLRAVVALLAGNIAAVCIELFGHDPGAGALVLVWCLGCLVSAWILSSGARGRLTPASRLP
jgi:hypothetical protein